MSKIYARFRMIEINYGEILDAYFINSANSHDPSSIESKNFIIKNSSGHKAKFTTFRMQLTIFEGVTYKVYAYLISWVIKLFTYFIFLFLKSRGRISAVMCKVINF